MATLSLAMTGGNHFPPLLVLSPTNRAYFDIGAETSRNTNGQIINRVVGDNTNDGGSDNTNKGHTKSYFKERVWLSITNNHINKFRT